MEEMSREKEEQERQKEQQKAYEQYVKAVTPTHSLWSQMLHAFITGGIICCIGQGILNYAGSLGLDKQTAGSWCSLLLVLLSVILTGFGVFEDREMGRRGSTGAHHGLRQLRGGSGHRVQGGGAGVRNRVQDFYDCGAGDSVWDIFQLGVGGGLLDWEDDGVVLRIISPCRHFH